MTRDEIMLEAMLQLSDKARPHNDHWFSWANQQRLVFRIAERSYVEFNMEPEEAIRGAREFVNTYYKMEIKH